MLSLCVFGVPWGWREALPPFNPSELQSHSLRVCPSASIGSTGLSLQGEHHCRDTLGCLFHLTPLHFQLDFDFCLKCMVIPCLELTRRIFHRGFFSCPNPEAELREQIGAVQCLHFTLEGLEVGRQQREVFLASGYSHLMTWPQLRNAGKKSTKTYFLKRKNKNKKKQHKK